MRDIVQFYQTKAEIESVFEGHLNPFAQKSSYAERFVNIDYTTGNRTEFQRDKDRILHCKYFRRLMHKTQIFAERDEYYRTRLTHTLEVSQIARSIARVLGVNEDLTEAIALGHDIGHTPFGHVGERILNDILTCKENLGGKVKVGCGGFNHNYQAIRVLDKLPTYIDQDGLNLTWQVREGIWKHTKIRKKSDQLKGDGINKNDLLCNYPNFNYKGLFKEYDYSVTIEGQIVAQADEIAQRAHDLDDGLRSGDIKLKELKSFGPAIFNCKEILKIKRAKPGQEYLWRQEAVRQIIQYFTKQLIENSIKNLNTYWIPENILTFNSDHIITKRLVKFSKPVQDEMDLLEKNITARVVNSNAVNICDGKAIFLIKHVVKALIANPRQLPVKVQKKIKARIRGADLACIDLSNGSREEVANCISIWQGNNNDNMNQDDVLKQHKIFLREIVNYVASLTDNQLNEVYKRLYVPN